VAAANMKQVNKNEAITSGGFLPATSLTGPNRAGPVAKPTIYSVNPKVATTLPT